MKKLIIALTFIATLAGCATPVGKLTSDDLNFTNITVNKNYQAVYRDIKKGFDSCKWPFVMESDLYTDIAEARIVFYPQILIFNSKAGWVLALVNIKQDGDKSSVSIGYRKFYDSERNRFKADLLNWINGKMSCD